MAGKKRAKLIVHRTTAVTLGDFHFPCMGPEE